MNIRRKIIEIDEERCNGCGQCVLDCAEGAIRIVNGKAKVISDNLCDGLGACLGGCPQDALRIVERMAPAFDEKAVQTHLAEQKTPPLHGGCPGSLAEQLHRPAGGCPSSRPMNVHPGAGHMGQAEHAGHWPVKLRLMPGSAPFLSGAHLLLAADCAPVVCQDFSTMAQGKVVLTSCPKFEDTEALSQKLTEICAGLAPSRITVLRMEVPCCQRLAQWVNEAVARAAQQGAQPGVQPVPVTHLCLGRDGRLLGID